MQGRTNATYIKRADRAEMANIVKAVAFPVILFFLSLFVIDSLKNFGSLLMAPAIAVMWLMGTVVAIWMGGNHRKDVLTQTMLFIAGYDLAELGLQKAVAITSGVSPSMLMATFQQPITTATANALPGYLQNLMYLMSILIPGGYIVMQAKRVAQFHRTANVQKIQKQLRAVRGDKDGRMY